MRRLAVIICSLLLALAAHAQDASVLLAYVTAESGWNPRNLGTKLACWFDASDGATLLDAGGAPADAAEAVQTWQDKSGNGRHATAPAEAQRPKRQVGVQNGRAVVRTDGGDMLFISNSGGVFRNKTAGYIFAVAKDAAPTGGAYVSHTIVGFSTAVGVDYARFYIRTRYASNGASAVGRRLDADSLLQANVGSVSGYALIMAFANWSGGTLGISTNGSSFFTQNFTSSGATSDTEGLAAYLFASKTVVDPMPVNSEIAEVIVVNAAMSTDEIQATERYLKDKWGTP